MSGLIPKGKYRCHFYSGGAIDLGDRAYVGYNIFGKETLGPFEFD
jgi:hypothetical protein